VIGTTTIATGIVEAFFEAQRQRLAALPRAFFLSLLRIVAPLPAGLEIRVERAYARDRYDGPNRRPSPVEPCVGGFFRAGKDETMRKTLLLLTAASGALAVAATASRAAAPTRPILDAGVTQAHAVRICDEDGDCWWSDGRHRGGYWDDRRDRWRHGYRDDDYYGRAPRDRDWDRDDFRRERGMRDRERGDLDRDEDRDRMGRGADRDRDRSARDDSWRDRDKDLRTGADQGMKERGEQSGAQTNSESGKN
jgi:hypothetical protein